MDRDRSSCSTLRSLDSDAGFVKVLGGHVGGRSCNPTLLCLALYLLEFSTHRRVVNGKLFFEKIDGPVSK